MAARRVVPSALDDNARSAIAHFEKRHETAGAPAAAQRLAFTAQMAEIGSRSRTILKESSFADPKVHDSVSVDEIVANALDEASMRLRMFVRAIQEAVSTLVLGSTK